MAQPPSGGCVLKRLEAYALSRCLCQPPSGGCVLKQEVAANQAGRAVPAAFGRLCVETSFLLPLPPVPEPAAFGRLCVETRKSRWYSFSSSTSRLRAAVC